MVVVTSILAVLSAIIGLSVTGRGTESRRAVQTSDEDTIQRAVDRYSGEHPQGRYPTLNGCPPGLILDLITRQCIRRGAESNTVRVDEENLEFVFQESLAGVDLNNDGDSNDSFAVAPIIWHKAFKTGLGLSPEDEVRRFLGGYVPRAPKHAFEFLEGIDASWEDGLNADVDLAGNKFSDPALITAPSGIGPGSNGIDLRIAQVPVWVIGMFAPNAGIEVRNLLPHPRY
jgi:hypothetical protein